MKRMIKSGFALLMALVFVFCFSLSAQAQNANVTFEDGKVIAFAPGSVYTDTDLFDNFKGVMPGDVRTEKVTIENKAKDFDYIKVYVRAVLHDEKGNPISDKVLAQLQADERRQPQSELEYMYDFLAQLSMKVWNGSNQIYQESPDQLDGLALNVYLGTLRQGDSVDLNVELDVPLDLSSEYSNRIGEVDWVFVVEGYNDEKPAVPTGPSLIQTGQLLWPIPILAGCGIALITGGIIINKRRKKENV